MRQKEEFGVKDVKKFALILLLTAALVSYFMRGHIFDFWLDKVYVFAALIFSFLLYSGVRAYRLRKGRICCACGVEIKRYRDTLYCLRWNSGRKPTPLFFCRLCGTHHAHLPYKDNPERGEEDEKSQSELYAEMRGSLKKDLRGKK